MIKRIIFDLDGTLISNVDFDYYMNRAFLDCDYIPNKGDIFKINNALSFYEEKANRYNVEEMLDFVRLYSGVYIPDCYFEYLLKELEVAVPKELEEGIVDTLEYLKDKEYSLAVLTNWYKYSQLKRLENAGILKYFDAVYSGEIYKKPSKEAYVNACGVYLPEESLMVGDSYKYDYEGALNANLSALLLDKDNFCSKDVDKIDSIKRLQRRL